MNTDRRGPWYLITGLILGAAVGLLYSWVISPVKYVDTAPVSLRADFKDTYRKVIAAAFASDKDIGRARARLALLGDPDPAQGLAALAQRLLAEGGSSTEARSLALLAAALGQQPVASEVASQTPSPLPKTTITPSSPSPIPSLTPSPSPTITLTRVFTVTPSPTAGLTQLLPSATPTRPTPTLTVTSATKVTPLPTRPSLTPSLTPGLPFVLKERSQVCDAARTTPLLQVQLNDAAGNPVPGIEISISWTNGEDYFYTGFKPEINPGYADFEMTTGVVYSLQIMDGGAPVSGITTVDCTLTGGGTYPGGWYLKFSQP